MTRWWLQRRALRFGFLRHLIFKFKKSGEFFVGPHYKSATNAPK
jgi:hypothetical protein